MSTIEAVCESDPGPCINYNKHIGGSRPEREFESLRRLKGHCYNSGRPQAAKNSSKQTGHGFVTSGFNLRSNHGTIAIVRYSSSRRGLLLSWIISRHHGHGSIRSSRYHAKRTRCVTKLSLSYSKCHSFSRVNRRTLFYFRFTSVCK